MCKRMLKIGLLLLALLVIAIVVSWPFWGIVLFPLHAPAAERKVATYQESLALSMDYIKHYTSGDVQWYFSKDGTIHQYKSGKEETMYIAAEKYRVAFDELYRGGVQSIEFNEKEGCVIFIICSDLSESRGVMYYEGNADDLFAYDMPFEEITLEAIDGYSGWYFYIHKTID